MLAQIAARRFAARSSLLIAILLSSFLLAACDSSNPNGTTASCGPDSASLHLVTAGTLTVATDPSHSPQTFIDPDQPAKYDGSDLDLIREIGKRLCPQTAIIKVDFDAIIPGLITPSLGSQHYDLAISAFSITANLQQQVDMLPYFQAGESLLVLAGNPQHITSLANLCDKSVAVQQGTAAFSALSQQDQSACRSNPFQLLSFASEDDAVAQLLNGSVAATYQDSPVTDYYAFQNQGKLAAGPLIAPALPEGIVMRKDNPGLENAVKKALCAMVQDGTYTAILKQWGQESGILPQSQFLCS
jgi:polar amino acid transport system substrate-binding protein